MKNSHDLVLRLKTTSTHDPIPHLTCIGHNESEIAAILKRYTATGRIFKNCGEFVFPTQFSLGFVNASYFLR